MHANNVQAQCDIMYMWLNLNYSKLYALTGQTVTTAAFQE